MGNWIYSFEGSKIEQVHELMKNEWWCADRTFAEVSKVIVGSDLCIGYIDSNNSVAAFLRVLTDSVFKAVCFDVIVRPDHRSTGLGRKIISHAVNHEKLRSVKTIELYCPDRISGFYQNIGFNVSDSKLHQLSRRL